MAHPVTDSAAIAKIEAAYALSLYRAERLLYLRLAGRVRPPRRMPQLPEQLGGSLRS